MKASLASLRHGPGAKTMIILRKNHVRFEVGIRRNQSKRKNRS